MKVAIPVKDTAEGKLMIQASLFDCGGVCLFDPFTETTEWKSIKEITEKAGNLSIALKMQNVKGVILSDIDIVELGLLSESGFKVFKSFGLNALENIKMLEEGQLKKLTLQAALGCSSGSCSSCSSGCES